MSISRNYLWLLLFFCCIGTIHSSAKTNSNNIYSNPINLVKTTEQEDCLKTLTDISEDGSLYELNYTSDYQLDKFIKSNISSHEKLAIKVGFNLMKPLKTFIAVR